MIFYWGAKLQKDSNQTRVITSNSRGPTDGSGIENCKLRLKDRSSISGFKSQFSTYFFG